MTHLKFKAYISNKRIFNDFNSFIRFYRQNQAVISNVRVKPPKLGDIGFGSVTVETSVNPLPRGVACFNRKNLLF